MDPQQQFCLKWNSFGSNLVSTFDSLFKTSSLTDVTLFCEGVTFQAHKLILAACSKHFQDLFESAPLSPSILVILDGTSSSNMSALLEFMYKGEVHVAQESLSSFLKAAEYLQVKGLSVEHEKLVTQQPPSVHSAPPTLMDSRMGSPNGGGRHLKSGGKHHHGSHQNMISKLEEAVNNSCRGLSSMDVVESMLPPSSSSSSPYSSSPYHLGSYKTPLYHEQQQQRPPSSLGGGSGHPLQSGYDMFSRRRPHRSPTEQLREPLVRDTVLKNGPKRERESPISLAGGYIASPSSSASSHQFADSLPPPATLQQPSSVMSSEGSAGNSLDQTVAAASAAVEKSPSPQWHSNDNCATDLRIKCDSNEGGGGGEGATREGDEAERRYYSSYECSQRERERERDNICDRIPPLPPLELIVSSPSTVSSNPAVSCYPTLQPGKIDPHHRGVTTTTTADGKKLRCPYCERLYGYETNLRAHIRQRHQGIRVPCPFCTRTFTRNNTVRRHIAREHKNELSLKIMPPTAQPQVQNHNQ